MCKYTGHHFGAAYEDACCIEGYLYDLDSGDGDGFSSGGDIPCPRCNTGAYLAEAREDAENTSWGASMTRRYSGAMILEGALRTAEEQNSEAVKTWKAQNSKVETFDWPDRQAVLDHLASPENIQAVTIVL